MDAAHCWVGVDAFTDTQAQNNGTVDEEAKKVRYIKENPIDK